MHLCYRLFTFLYPISYQSAQFFRRALHYASGSRQFLRQSAQPFGKKVPLSLIDSRTIWYTNTKFRIYTNSNEFPLTKRKTGKEANISYWLLSWEIESASRFQIMTDAVRLSLHAKGLGKGMNSVGSNIYP